MYTRARVPAHPQESRVWVGLHLPGGFSGAPGCRTQDSATLHHSGLLCLLLGGSCPAARFSRLCLLDSRTLGSLSPFIALLCFLSFHPWPAHSCNSFIDWSLFRPGHLPGSLGSMPTRTPPRSTSSPPASLHSGMKLLWWHPSPHGVCPSGP